MKNEKEQFIEEYKAKLPRTFLGLIERMPGGMIRINPEILNL